MRVVFYYKETKLSMSAHSILLLFANEISFTHLKKLNCFCA